MYDLSLLYLLDLSLLHLERLLPYYASFSSLQAELQIHQSIQSGLLPVESLLARTR